MQTQNSPLSPPSFFKLALETRSITELWAFGAALPLLKKAPHGDGHPVIVLPGYLASDTSTIPLRMFLKDRGYKTYGWGQGRNYGRGLDSKDGVTRQTNMFSKLLYLHDKHQQKISLIGWSLGGVYARELARLLPDCVRQVITLGSPFNGGERANNVRFLFERTSGKSVAGFSPELLDRVKQPPPVPTTAVFTRTDGIVAWQSCLENQHPFADNVEVEGSHCGLGHNPAVLWVVADRLAQQEGTWQPFRRDKLRKFIYRDPQRTTFY